MTSGHRHLDHLGTSVHTAVSVASSEADMEEIIIRAAKRRQSSGASCSTCSVSPEPRLERTAEARGERGPGYPNSTREGNHG